MFLFEAINTNPRTLLHITFIYHDVVYKTFQHTYSQAFIQLTHANEWLHSCMALIIMHPHTRMRTYTHTHTHTRTHTHAHFAHCICTRMDTYTHARIYTHAHTHTPTCVHTHTCTHWHSH